MPSCPSFRGLHSFTTSAPSSFTKPLLSDTSVRVSWVLQLIWRYWSTLSNTVETDLIHKIQTPCVSILTGHFISYTYLSSL